MSINLHIADKDCHATLAKLLEPLNANATGAPILVWDMEAPLPEGGGNPYPLTLILSPPGVSEIRLPEGTRAFWLHRPVPLKDVRQKIDEILRVSKESLPERLTDKLHYDSRLRVLRYQGKIEQQVTLTDLEAKLFSLLYEECGQSISRADLLARIWGYAENIETRTLEAHVYRLRQKLAALYGDSAPELEILTDDSGYQLTREA